MVIRSGTRHAPLPNCLALGGNAAGSTGARAGRKTPCYRFPVASPSHFHHADTTKNTTTRGPLVRRWLAILSRAGHGLSSLDTCAAVFDPVQTFDFLHSGRARNEHVHAAAARATKSILRNVRRPCWRVSICCRCPRNMRENAVCICSNNLRDNHRIAV